jgi:SWI/SNF-related matrix-associated actin-dependent regulator of chromatin subfamily D
MIQAIHSSKLKRDFMNSFIQNPVEFINRWVASQSKDLKVILGDEHVYSEDMRRADFYQQDRIKEAMFHYLSSRDLN